MKLIFGTGNKNKLAEAQAILTNFEIEGAEVEVEEIQSLDPVKVAVQKAKDYFSKVNASLFIEDVSLKFEALNGLPGTYIDAFMKALDNPGILKLLANVDNRNAIALITMVYIKENSEPQVFQFEMPGTIATEIRGTNGFGWDSIFIPEGENKTLAEMSFEEKNKYSMRTKALQKLKEWLESN